MQQFKFGDKVWIKGEAQCGTYIGYDAKDVDIPHSVMISHTTRLRGWDILWYTDSDIEPYTGQDKPKIRLMTRDEVLYFIATTPGIVVRFPNSQARPAQYYPYSDTHEGVEWAYASPTGEYEWRKFEVAE